MTDQHVNDQVANVVIRRMQACDQQDWLDLWAGYNTFYKRSVTDTATNRTWNSLLAGNGEPYGYVAELDGKAVGFAHYFMTISTSDDGPRCYLQDLFADPEVRGKGVGRALIQAVYEDADQHNASQTYWLTAEDNLTARKLYDAVANQTPFIKYAR